MAKKVDQLKAKEKKQKIIAAVGGVLLLGLLAFQVPRVMKQLNKKAPPPPVASTTTAAPASGTPTLAPPSLAGASTTTPAAAAPASAGGVTSGDGAPPPQEGQLTSFSRFASKDPFAQQLADNSAGGAVPSSAGSSGSAGSGGLSGSGSSGSSGAGSVPGSGGSSGGGTRPGPGGAVISVNGTLLNVTVGTDFPTAGSDPSVPSPIFHLVSVGAHSAQISIAGGSYASGAATVTLREGKPVTLMNTADGTRYKLVLRPQGTPVSTPSASGSSASGSTAPASPATTTP